MRTAVIVLAAGRGERLGGKTPKAFVEILGRTILERALDNLMAFNGFGWVQPVIPGEAFERYAALDLPADPRLASPVTGGAERQDSVAAGLAALPQEFELVAIHDAARCGVQAADIARVVSAAEEFGAALLAVPARDTVKLVAHGAVARTPERGGCWLAQTPQVFHRGLYSEALAKAEADGFRGTDDAELVERLGAQVRVVSGNPSNFKITSPEDLAAAERGWVQEKAQ